MDIVLSYKMPPYKVDGRSLHVAAWKHGMSLYGWDGERDGGFVERHPEMTSGKGTLRLRLAEAETITDDELRAVIDGALSDPQHRQELGRTPRGGWFGSFRVQVIAPLWPLDACRSGVPGIGTRLGAQ